MRNPLKTERSTDIGLLLARLPLGVLFVIAGCNKLVADGGFRKFAADNEGLLPSFARNPAGGYYLLSLPFLEIVAGLLIVLGLLTRLGGFLATGLMVSIIIAKETYRNGNAPHPNLVFLSVALMLFLAGGGKISLDGLFFKKKSGFGG
jgi:uncharacterized membrane protein YphA (DoxX/SURF4 family)